MRKLVIAGIALVVVVAAGLGYGVLGGGEGPRYTVPAQIGRFSAAQQGTSYSGLAFAALDGQERVLEDFAGQVVVVNLWATWCTPCVAEMPALERMHQQLRGSGVAVAAISVDRGGAKKVEPFLAEVGLESLPIYLDPKGRSLQAFGAKGLPTTVILDTEGREIGRVIGPAEWDAAPVVDYLKGLAGQA